MKDLVWQLVEMVVLVMAHSGAPHHPSTTTSRSWAALLHPVQFVGLRDLIHHICGERSIRDGNLFFVFFNPRTVESNHRVQRASRSANSISFLFPNIQTGQ